MTKVPEHSQIVDQTQAQLITRREAIRRVSFLMAGATLTGGNGLLTACSVISPGNAAIFSVEDIAFLDTVAETILPETSTPGAKAAEVGAFMALMVTDAYDHGEQRIFRTGMRQLDAESVEMNGVPFMAATPAQQLALLERLDLEQKNYMDARRKAQLRRSLVDTLGTTAAADAYLIDGRQQNAVGTDADAAPAISADAPAHYFRMMKELALLGYFTSEIGYTQAMRYKETPGGYEPRVPLAPGEKSWAPHA